MTPLVLPLLPQSMAKNCPPVLVYQKKFLDGYFAIRPLLLAKSLGCQASGFMRWDQYDVTAVGRSLLLVWEFHGRWVVLRVGTLINELLYLSEHNPRLGLVIAILVHCFAGNFASVLCPCLPSKKKFYDSPFVLSSVRRRRKNTKKYKHNTASNATTCPSPCFLVFRRFSYKFPPENLSAYLI